MSAVGGPGGRGSQPTDRRDAAAGAGLHRERTALAWSRTGLSFAIAGAVLLRLLHETEAGMGSLWLSVALVGLGSVAWCWGWRTSEVTPAIESLLGRVAATVLAVGLAVVAAAAILLQL